MKKTLNETNKVAVNSLIEEQFLKVCSSTVAGLLPREIISSIPNIDSKKFVEVANALIKAGKISAVRIDNQILYRTNDTLSSSKSKAKTLISENKFSEEISNKNELTIFKSLEQAGDKGLKINEIRDKVKLTFPTIKKILKILETRGNVKSFTPVSTNHMNANEKVYFTSKATPKVEITGGNLYNNMNIDTNLTESLINEIVNYLENKYKFLKSDINEVNINLNRGISSVDEIFQHLSTLTNFKNKVNIMDIENVLEVVVYSGKARIILSNDREEKKVSYQFERKLTEAVPVGVTMTPCCYCQQRRFCSMEGTINPRDCTYYKDWLGL